MKPVDFITSNKGKLEEIQARLKPIGYNVTQRRYGYPEIQADTLEEVVQYGIEHIIKNYDVKGGLLIDDSGLFIDELNGFPGVYSRYVLDSIDYFGLFKQMKDYKNRKAYFETCLGYKEPGKDIIFAHGKCEGEISVKVMNGEYGFGFDPIFQPYVDGKLSDRSFAQMNIAEKNRYSHRSLAITDLVQKLGR